MAYFTGSIKISGKNSYVAEARGAIKNGDDKQGKLSYIDGIKFSYSDELVRELEKFESENLVEEELNKVKKLIEEKNYIEAISILDRLKIREKTSTLKIEF